MKRILLLCLAYLVLGASGAQAQLLIEKSRVEQTVRPGTTIADTMVVHNRSSEPVAVKIYWQDFNYVSPYNGTKEFLPPGTSPYSMNGWVTFSPQQMVIPAQSKKEVDYTIKVPADAVGGHYGVLFFEQGAVKAMNATGVNIVTRLGALFFIDSTNRSKKLDSSDLKEADGTFSGSMRNEGNVYLFPKGQYYVMNSEGLVLDRGKLDKIYLPPKAEASYSFKPKKMDPGHYTLVLTFDLDEGDSLTREADFVTQTDGRIEIRTQRH